MLINRAVVQLIDQIANKTWEITDQESVTEIDVDWFGDFHRYSLFMNGGNSMSKKRKSRKQLKRELKFKTGCWKQSVKENHQLRGRIVELERHHQNWLEDYNAENTRLRERRADLEHELLAANITIEKIRDTLRELLTGRISDWLNSQSGYPDVTVKKWDGDGNEVTRDGSKGVSYQDEGEPPPGLTRYVLSKKYPPFPDISDDNKD